LKVINLSSNYALGITIGDMQTGQLKFAFAIAEVV